MERREAIEVDLGQLRPAQAGGARELSLAPGSSFLGEGGGLFLFAHSVRPAGTTVEGMLGEGISVHSRHGQRMVELGRDGVWDELEGYAGVALQVPPGHYRVRVGGDEAAVAEHMVTVVAGYQTQVFLPLRLDGRFARGGARLQGIRTVMAELGAGFDPVRPDLRLAEACTNALTRPWANEWRLVSEVFKASDTDPLLALYGAHLLLEMLRAEGREQGADALALLEEAVVRCLERLGPVPDVVALVLGLRMQGALGPALLERLEAASAGGAALGTGSVQVWERPEGWTSLPMLYASWRLLVQSTIATPRLVRSGSLLDQLAEAIIPEGPWLSWRVAQRPARVELVDEYREGAMARRVALAEQVDLRVRAGADLPSLDRELSLQRLERSLLLHVVQHRAGRIPAGAYLGDAQLIRALGVPWVTAQRTVTTLARKLETSARAYEPFCL